MIRSSQGKIFPACFVLLMLAVPMFAGVNPSAVSNAAWMKKNFSLSDDQVAKVLPVLSAEADAVLADAKAWQDKTDRDSSAALEKRGLDRWVSDSYTLESFLTADQKKSMGDFRNVYTNQNRRILSLVFRVALTYDQTAAVQAIFDAMRQSMGSPDSGERPDPSQMRARMKDTEDKISAILMDYQKALYQKWNTAMRARMKEGGHRGQGGPGGGEHPGNGND